MGKFSKLYIAQTNTPELTPEQVVNNIIANPALTDIQKKSGINEYLLSRNININTLNLPEDFKKKLQEIVYTPVEHKPHKLTPEEQERYEKLRVKPKNIKPRKVPLSFEY